MRTAVPLALLALLAGCNQPHEIAPPAEPLQYGYRICDDDCERCTGDVAPATVHFTPNGVGTLAFADRSAMGQVDTFSLSECRFLSNGGWDCTAKADMNITADPKNALAHLLYKRRIGFKDGQYFIGNGEKIPQWGQRASIGMLQTAVCLVRK